MNVLSLVGGVSGLATASQAIVGVTTCVALLGFELPQRVAGLRSGSVSVRSYAKGAASIACRCAPEMLGVMLCMLLALALRARGDVDEVFHSEQELAIWEEIKQEWPILCGADTLLNLQTWLRLAVLMLVAARCKVGEAIPLGGMAAVLFLAAMVARSAMAARTTAYRLEGPLAMGGDLPIACEVAMLPRLAWLSVQAFRETPVAVATWLGVTAWFASFHYLNMASDPDADKLFTLAHALEFVAAMAFLINTIISHCGSKAVKGCASAGLMHLVMPVQAALGAYFFLTAFGPHPNLVSSGRPYCLLVWSNLLQLGAYLVAAAFFIASQYVFTDVPAEEGRDFVVTRDQSVGVELPSPDTIDATAAEISSACEVTRETLVL